MKVFAKIKNLFKHLENIISKPYQKIIYNKKIFGAKIKIEFIKQFLFWVYLANF